MDSQVDLVVVGAGLAGLSAACRAGELGLRVAVLEQGTDSSYLCNTRYSGGVMVVGGLPATSPPDDLAAALQRVTFGATTPELTAMLSANAGRVLEWLSSNGAEFSSLTFQPGQTFSEVLAPTGLDTTALDWRDKGADVLLRRLADVVAAQGNTLLLGHRATRLLVDGKRVVGVEAESDGEVSTWHARGVLLADGGFQGNRELVMRYIAPSADQVFLRSAPTGQGWGLEAAARLGAKLVNVNSFYGHPLSIDARHNDRLWPYPVLDPIAEAGIVVDRNGHRFTDEGLGGVDVTNKLARRKDPFAFIICDDEAWRGPAAAMKFPPAANPSLENNGGTLYRADTIEELAAKAGIPVVALVETVQKYSAARAAGTAGDLDVPRSIPAGQTIYAGPSRREIPAIATPPFRAIPIIAGISFTMGGPLIDANARVIHESGAAIIGLYAAGASSAGFDGGTNVGYAGGLVKAAVTGVIAAEHVGSLVDAGEKSNSTLDREQIRQLMLRYAAAVDRRDFDMVASCFVDDAVAAYDEGSQSGSSGPIEGVDRIVEYISGISHTDSSMHFLGTSSVELAHDTATVVTDAVSFLVYPDASGQRIVTRSIRYEDGVVRTRRGWKSRHVHHARWRDDTVSLLDTRLTDTAPH